MYLGSPCYDYAFNCHLIYLAMPEKRPYVMHEKAKFICFIYMHLQKVKFKSLQINMKQVSYTDAQAERCSLFILLFLYHLYMHYEHMCNQLLPEVIPRCIHTPSLSDYIHA